MSSTQASDEVAEDYRASLETLTTNDRYGINNFTVIAKEYIEHADKISKVLEEHIRNAPPAHKLPALYVLDSIAKNVGSPYTLFLGHNLYKTFMGAYSLVDHQVRKKLDEMLKTWKSPVPGSIDTRPVFPPEITRGIENALIQAKTLAIQQQQQQQRDQQELLRRRAPTTIPLAQWRNTPTPPQYNGHFPPPSFPNYPSQQAMNGNQIRHQMSNIPNTPYMQDRMTHLFGSGVPDMSHAQSLVNVEILKRDIDNLVAAAKEEFAGNIYDGGVQTRLKALLDLQAILKTQQLPPNQIQAVRDQVNVLQSNQSQPIPRLSTPAITPAVVATATPPPIQISYSTLQPNLASLPSASSLASLLESVARTKSTQPPPPSNPPIPAMQALSQQPQLPPSSIPVALGGESSLIASLRAAGLLLPTGNTLVNGASVPPRTSLTTLLPPPPAIRTPPHQITDQLVQRRPKQPRNDVELTSASLKRPRKHLIFKLYGARPNQCATCGIRFLASNESKTRKARHLDWHFRTNQRLVDSVKRGISRSWYVDELEWIKSRENEEEGLSGSPGGGKDSREIAAAVAAKNDPKTKYISVPSDNNLSSLPCPICQEKFDTSWNDEVQDWVWMDAEKIGSRVYHASCYAEFKKDKGDSPSRRDSTPDSVLGKRKAETQEIKPSPTKVKRELAA